MPFARSNSYISTRNNADTRSAGGNQGVQDPSPNKTSYSPHISKPKFKLEDMIISAEAYDSLTTVIHARECRQKVFEDWDLKSVMPDKQSLMVNIYGAPGTGKTMAAHSIAHALNKNLICVNYAEIESKYVGETGKNLTKLFEFASLSDVIIFFDEADAFLSKRVTNMSSSTDVSVNQTRSVLLTLLNDYAGMVIFATNFISNYDPAFMRRIQYHIKLEMPNSSAREKLWRKYIPPKMPAKIDCALIAEKFDNITGSDISNAVLKAALKAAKYQISEIPQSYFEEAVKEIISSKEANSGYSVVTRPVSEEYALGQIKKSGGKV